MTLAELHPIWKECLAIHEAFRRLGFTADDLMVQRSDDGRMLITLTSVDYGCFCNIKNGDSRAFALRALKELLAEWIEAAKLWNTCSTAEAVDLFNQSRVHEYAIALILDIQAHNIAIPSGADA
jgi:hypothetical protein